jgi:hypothetical protein
VHRFRAAETFKLIIDKGNYVIEDIASKIAKSKKFILQWLGLQNLNAEWKKLCLKDEMSISKGAYYSVILMIIPLFSANAVYLGLQH